MKTKVIHLLGHSPSINARRHISEAVLPSEKYYIEIDEYPFWIGFFKEDFHVQIANEIKKRTDEYEIECWRPNCVVNGTYYKNIDGILNCVFPSQRVDFIGYMISEHSDKIIERIKNESQKRNLILHLYNYPVPMIMRIAKEFGHLPIYSPRLGSPMFLEKRASTKNHFKKMFFNYYASREKKVISNFDYLTTITSKQYIFLKNLNSNVSLRLHVGIDTNYWTGDKCKSRKILKIPDNKKIMLHVNRFDNVKGAKVIVEAFNKLKKKWDVSLHFIGGYIEKDNPLISYCNANGVDIIERVPKEVLRHYYLSADVCVAMLLKDDLSSMNQGFGTALMESIAANLPIVGNILENYPGNSREVGLIPDSPDTISDSVEYIFHNPSRFENINKFAEKYFGWNIFVDEILEKYRLMEIDYGYKN